MFIVKFLNQKHLFMNAKEDEFMEAFAKNHGLELSEIEADYISDETQKQIRRFQLSNPGVDFQFDLENLKLFKFVAPAEGENIPGREDVLTLQIQKVLKFAAANQKIELESLVN